MTKAVIGNYVIRYNSLFPITWEYQGRARLSLDLGFREDFLYEVTDKLKFEGRRGGNSVSAMNMWKGLRECTEAEIV